MRGRATGPQTTAFSPSQAPRALSPEGPPPTAFSRALPEIYLLTLIIRKRNPPPHFRLPFLGR